jgi:hypothetical protein
MSKLIKSDIDDDIILKYRKRIIRNKDLIDIKNLILEHPDASRRRLSALLCELWDWRQENGMLKDMVCRSLMLILHRAGHIQLPEVRYTPRNPIIERHSPKELEDTFDRSVITSSTKDISQSIEMKQVRKTELGSTFNSLIQSHHYLGYTNPIGEHLKYMFLLNDRPIACALWTSSALKIKPRDEYLGWCPTARDANVRMIAYNSRFLVLPWVHVKYLASHLLGRMSRQISEDWVSLYRHPIHLLETYIEPSRFRGSCYRAANWKMVGMTKGMGIRAKPNVKDRTEKEMFVYPCSKNSIKQLCQLPE